MQSLKAAREAAGLSQRALAARAGVAFRTVQLLEWGRHDARLSTLERISRALGRPFPTARLSAPGASASEACAAVNRDGADSWKGHLFDFVDAFRRSPSSALVEAAPPAETDARVLVLAAAAVECLCAEARLRPPWWCAGVPGLPEPWFVAGMESLKASALVESPAAFRRRNVFVFANFLERA